MIFQDNGEVFSLLLVSKIYCVTATLAQDAAVDFLMPTPKRKMAGDHSPAIIVILLPDN
jgi:hypothetical protein